MRTVHKFELEDETTTLPLEGAPVLHVGQQDGRLFIWVEVETDNLFLLDCEFRVFRTGERLPDDGTHVGTVQMPSGLVWHVYRMSQEFV